jgi:hypothetical protein
VPESQKPEFVVPEEAAGRGPIMVGELRSDHHRYPGMLAQFSKIAPHTRKARIYLFPTVEQAKLLYGSNGPFAFERVYATASLVMTTNSPQTTIRPPAFDLSFQSFVGALRGHFVRFFRKPAIEHG